MSQAKIDKKFDDLVQRIEPGCQLLRTWSLNGGVSAQVTGLEILRHNGEIKRWIARQHGEKDRQRNVQIAPDEFRLLKILRSVGIAVPTPIYLDEFREFFSVPVLVIDYVEGRTEFAPHNLTSFIHQFTRQLVRIHHLDNANADLSFLPEYGKGFGARPDALDESLDEGRIRAALESCWPLPQMNVSVLLHGDFWPGNWLWMDGRLVAVIDWEDASVGDPLADVANTRLEILWAFGKEALESFTQLYRSMTNLDFTHLPYWDLCAALRPASKMTGWGLDIKTEKIMRERHKWFTHQALNRLKFM